MSAGAGETIWIYQDVLSNGLIAKRCPFQYQSVLDPKTGEVGQIFTSGVETICPKWSSVSVVGDRTYATLDGVVYDPSRKQSLREGNATATERSSVVVEITDLMDSQNP